MASHLRSSRGRLKTTSFYIYEPDENKAIETLRHEYIDFPVNQAIEPYKTVANTFIKLLNETTYKKKEEVVNALLRVL